MKLTKLLILALGLFALTATAAFANVSFISQQGPRNLSVNSQTGEVSNIELVATRGEFGLFATAPANESIFLTFEADISSYEDITVTFKLGEFFPFTWVDTTDGFTGYNTWHYIYGWGGPPYGTSPIARVRVGIFTGGYKTMQIEFLQDVFFYEGNSCRREGFFLSHREMTSDERSTTFLLLSCPA